MSGVSCLVVWIRNLVETSYLLHGERVHFLELEFRGVGFGSKFVGTFLTFADGDLFHGLCVRLGWFL